MTETISQVIKIVIYLILATTFLLLNIYILHLIEKKIGLFSSRTIDTILIILGVMLLSISEAFTFAKIIF